MNVGAKWLLKSRGLKSIRTADIKITALGNDVTFTVACEKDIFFSCSRNVLLMTGMEALFRPRRGVKHRVRNGLLYYSDIKMKLSKEVDLIKRPSIVSSPCHLGKRSLSKPKNAMNLPVLVDRGGCHLAFYHPIAGFDARKWVASGNRRVPGFYLELATNATIRQDKTSMLSSKGKRLRLLLNDYPCRVRRRK